VKLPETCEPADVFDGRHARRDRNKVAVVDAYLDLIRQGNSRPSVAEVAERSGVSHRSVFRYFSDKDEMARTSIQREQERMQPILSRKIDTSAGFEERVGALVALRVELFEAIAPVARLSRSLAVSQPLLKNQLEVGRAELRNSLRRTFARELSKFPDQLGAEVLATLDVVTSFEAYELYRFDQGLPVETVERVMRKSLHVLLTTQSADYS
jgi:TetR/AcrR family transcriptional regulator, regulator of autoinduction and epiphytic fitness